MLLPFLGTVLSRRAPVTHDRARGDAEERTDVRTAVRLAPAQLCWMRPALRGRAKGRVATWRCTFVGHFFLHWLWHHPFSEMSASAGELLHDSLADSNLHGHRPAISSRQHPLMGSDMSQHSLIPLVHFRIIPRRQYCLPVNGPLGARRCSFRRSRLSTFLPFSNRGSVGGGPPLPCSASREHAHTAGTPFACRLHACGERGQGGERRTHATPFFSLHAPLSFVRWLS